MILQLFARKTIFLSAFLIMVITMQAQQTNTDFTGIYLLTGVMETASAFELKKDSSFEFFFSQGALDRGGKGKWTVKDGRVIFNSVGERPPKDYAIVSCKAVPGNYTIIKMVDKNTTILSYSDVTLKTATGILQKSTDSHGEVQFDKKHATSIALLFRLCPDRESVFTTNPAHNYFEFRLEPWIADVFFKDFNLKIDNDQLSGTHPILEGGKFRYEKQKEQ